MPLPHTTESVTRLGRLAQDGTLDQVLRSVRQGNPLPGELGLSQGALKSLIETPPHQLESGGESPVRLEAIIELVRRPPLIIRNGTVEGKHTITDFFGPDISGKITKSEKYIPSIGRIEFLNHAQAWGGTGWIVDERGGQFIIATNRHVAAIVARRTYRGDAVFAYGPGNVKYRARIDFNEEIDSRPDPASVHEITGFSYLADDISADVALALIDKPGGATHLTPLPLADSNGDDGELVATVGYPAYDSRNAHVYMERYFQGLYDIKRFSPGRLIATGDILSHDCTTLGGNSGSPLVSLDRGAVVGLHFAGAYRQSNSAVRVSTLKALLAGQGPSQVLGAHAAPSEAADKPHDSDHFAGRQGYDPAFLRAVSVPLPELPTALNLARPSDAPPERPHELRYQHFSVLYSALFKGPVVTALNIDGAQSQPIKRRNATWFHDLRIPRAIQLGQQDYAHADIDRGHMVRRSATNWGSPEQARTANLDSFHYTNASPQHRRLNRAHDQWLGLEDYLLGNARTHGFRATVFTGPVYTPDAPPLGTSGAPLPLHFWKVVAMLAEGADEVIRLHATAYLLSQGELIQAMLQQGGGQEATEGFAFGTYKTFQIRITDLEAMTGYDFGPLRTADPLAHLAQTEAAIAPRPVIELQSLSQIVI